MPDYAKMKNSELEALLKQRSLPSGGKKADMVARLVEADGNAGSDPAKAEAEPTTAEAPPAKAAAAPSTATSSDAKPVEPTADPAAPAPGAGDDAADKKDAEPAAADVAENQAEGETKPAVDFTTGLAATSIDEEIARRKKRAAKFGVTDDTETAAIKNLERQKRFAVEGGKEAASAPRGVHGLDEALPERINRKRGRGEEEAADKESLSLEDSALKRRRGGGGFRGRGRGRGQGRGGGGGGGGSRQAAPGSWMSEADKKAADARKARFAAKPAQ